MKSHELTFFFYKLMYSMKLIHNVPDKHHCSQNTQT